MRKLFKKLLKSKVLKYHLIVFPVIVCIFSLLTHNSRALLHPDGLTFTPWNAVGGCGAGGSGGGGGDGIKWIGQGVSGGLIDVEVLPKFAAGQNFFNVTVSPRFSYKITSALSAGLTFPFSSKTGEVQPRSNLPAKNRTTGGLGDLSLDMSYTFGSIGQFSVSFSQTFPTAQYDIVRGSDRDKIFLPSSLQKGSGMFSSTLGIGFTKDVENGIWLADLSVSNSWMARIKGKNRMIKEYFKEYFKNITLSPDDKRFYYTFKPYGENDFGDFTPPSVSANVHYGYRGVRGQVHSFGMTFSFPLGVAWIRDPSPGIYDPKPDPDHKAWSASFVYGIEFSRESYPLFIAFALPIHDKAPKPEDQKHEWDEKPMTKWNGPDWGDFLQQWTIGFGFKSTFF
jgi:hypothetical protein